MYVKAERKETAGSAIADREHLEITSQTQARELAMEVGSNPECKF